MQVVSKFTYTDNELLQQIAEEDGFAFALLYRRYWEELFVTAAKVLRGKHEAEDVVQDVFLSLWRRRCELKIEGSLAAYLHTSVRYNAIHYIEKNITHRDYIALLVDLSVAYLPANAEMDLQVEELQKRISNAVAKMPPKMQQVYRLSRHEQLSHKEIAKELSVSVETVKKHIQHALRLIKRALQYTSILILDLLPFHLI